MFAGLLNEPIQIYDFTKTKSSYGVVSDVLTLTYETRAKVSHIGGSRQVINGEIETPYSKNFVMRIYVPIKDTSWIKYDGKYYRVTSIDRDKAMQQTVVITQEVLDYVESTSYTSYTTND